MPHRDGGQSWVYLNRGGATFPQAARVPFGPADAHIRMAEASDLNGDGRLDIVAIDEGAGVFVFFGESDGTFSTGLRVGDGGVTPYALAVGDLDGDGAVDIIVGHVEAPSTVLWNDGTGRRYTPLRVGDAEGAVYGIAIADLDGDGRLDLAMARSDAPNVVYFADAAGSRERAAGGISALQRASGAVVAASPASARWLERGGSYPDDPQHGVALPFPPVPDVRTIADGEVLRVWSLAMTAHFTAGHTPGGTTWSWRSCEGERCVDIVYADSQTPVSADGFRFTDSRTYPSGVDDFAHGLAVLDRLPCDLLLTPHPSASGLFARVEARDRGDAEALLDAGACRRYAATARRQLAKRLAAESEG